MHPVTAYGDLQKTFGLMPQAWVPGVVVWQDESRGRRVHKGMLRRECMGIWYKAARPGGCARGRGAALQVIEGSVQYRTASKAGQRRAGNPARPPSAGGSGAGARVGPATSVVLQQVSGSLGATWGQWRRADVHAPGSGGARAGLKAEHFWLVLCAWAAAKRPRPAQMRARRLGGVPA